MALVDLVYTRTVQVVETGHVQVETDDPDDMHKVFKKANDLKFVKHLVTDRVYDRDDDEWDFDIIVDLEEEIDAQND